MWHRRRKAARLSAASVPPALLHTQVVGASGDRGRGSNGPGSAAPYKANGAGGKQIGSEGRSVEAGTESVTDKKARSQGLGVTVAYLLGPFIEKARLATSDDNPDFHVISARLFYGDVALGKGLVCPRDAFLDCAAVDALDANLDALPNACVNSANIFLSWVWSYTLSTVTDAIGKWIGASNRRPDDTHIWMCAFCNNQFRILVDKSASGTDNLDTLFEKRLTSIGYMVALLDHWQDPLYLTRVWTIYEQFTATKLGIHVEIILPAAEFESLESVLRSGRLDKVSEGLQHIDVSQAKATYEEDEKKVKRLISSTPGGFKHVNHRVKESMRIWCGHAFTTMLATTPKGLQCQERPEGLLDEDSTSL